LKERKLIHLIEKKLINKIVLERKKQHDPIKVKNIPSEWKCLGTGNYAAVFTHKDYPDVVVKIYAKEIDCLEKEAEVYRQLGDHPAYSKLIYKGENYLVLKKLEGITLYNAILKGIKIPESVIEDVNKALQYAKRRGLNPYDVHGKNVMMKDGRGFVVDVSDFYKKGKDEKWDDLVKVYYKFYKKTLYRFPVKVPNKVMDFVRHSYRFYKKTKNKSNSI
jgi:hypothetical protein